MAKEAQGNYARVKANILKSADKMPAEDYSFKPTRISAPSPASSTTSPRRRCTHAAPSTAINPDSYTVPPETADKATIVAALNASFAECDKAYASLTDANAGDMIQAGPVKRSR